jgi:hypothetical protein
MENLMPRFYSLNDAYEHGRKLIDKITFHLGYEDAEAWKVIVLNDDRDDQMIIPFSVSDTLRAQRRATGRESSKSGHPEGLNGIEVPSKRFEANIWLVLQLGMSPTPATARTAITSHRRFLPIVPKLYDAEGAAKFWRRVIIATPANFFRHAQLRYRSLDSM